MDSKTVGLSIVIVILLIIAAVGFFEYSTVQSQYSSVSSSYSSASQAQSSLSKALSQASANESYYMKLAQGNYSKYQALQGNYSSLQSKYQSLMQMYMALSHEGKSPLTPVFEFLDGVAIESPSDVTPFLSSNFTATVKGTPFPGEYDFNTFNSTWLSDFFSQYETVYFYTTALPTVTSSGSTYYVSAVVQYFVAPSSDPVYLQVFNASVTFTIAEVNGALLITSLQWNGNEIPPSAVIAGYPSQHDLQENQVTSTVLSQINALGAEFPANVIASSFSPDATLQINGQLPAGLKNGTYSGLSSIENFFTSWDNYFIFAAEYSQNLLPNGTAVTPSVSVQLSPQQANATFYANVTPFLLFVNKGEPTYPAIYDLHVSLKAELVYNSTTSSWEITNEVWNVTPVSTQSDTLYYNLNTPTFNVAKETTVTVNASKGAVVQAGNLVSVLKPGTYAELPNGSLESTYNFSLILMSVNAVYSPPGTNLTPTYAFAFAINGHISPAYSLVNASKSPSAVVTFVYAPDTWTSWTWFGGTFNGTTYTGGQYKFPDHWVYGDNMMVNIQFFKPVIWIFESSNTPVVTPPMPVIASVKPTFNLTTLNAYTYQVNGTVGGVINAGNIMVVIPPGTYVNTTSGQLKVYNFSVVYYSVQGIKDAPDGEVPFIAFAYAVNGVVSFQYSATNHFITLVMTPDMNAQMWTYGQSGYLFQDPILLGNGVMINLTFFKPVPWVITLPELNMSTTTSSTTTSGSGSGGYY
ncbi:hypothetical protein IC006_0365 [Sulfuracidifex tepidarius]|uniref:Uncharacterized protein n=1 Tax=Sulfuracidifex tepidarius TaxID=1294262 RepID=A0A510DSC2_9CREN|nr:hypothetical protein [Sulfuracidifex tepidarius]BBG23081.1 hypothetical protein IC006_0365 [Sulfuracidifex tepidarius]